MLHLKKERPLSVFTTVLLSSFLLLTSCSSLFYRQYQSVTLNCSPNQSTVSVSNKKGDLIYRGTTPVTVELPKAFLPFSPERYSVKFEKKGYKPYTDSIRFKLKLSTLIPYIYPLSWAFLPFDCSNGSLYDLKHSPTRPKLLKTENQDINLHPDTSEYIYKISKKKSLVYAKAEASFPGEYNINLNYIFKNRFIVEIGVSKFIKKPDGIPEDVYYSGLFLPIFPFGYYSFRDEATNIQALFGLSVQPNPKKLWRFSMKAGIGYATYTELINWREKNSSLIALLIPDIRYTYDTVTNTGFNVILKTDAEFLLTPYFGLSSSLTTFFDNKRRFVGIQIGATLGLLRNKRDKVFVAKNSY